MSDIVLKNVSKSFNGRSVLENFSHTFKAGTRCCIMGPSGCGKSTLLKLIAGIIKPDAGIIRSCAHLAYVFQEDRLIEHMTALENCALPLRHKTGAAEALAELGLKDSLDIQASKLSGGMARRVVIARALLFDSEAVLLDEPFKGLDEATKEIAVEFILKRLNGRTLICVTHSEEETKALKSEILRLT